MELWAAPGSAAPESLDSLPAFEPQDATNYALVHDVTSRLHCTDGELTAFHREAFDFAIKRQAVESGAQAFAGWCLDRVRDGEPPELWLLWKRFNTSAESEEFKAQRLERRRAQAHRLACRMGLSDRADDVASGVVEALMKGERPTRFAIIDWCRENGLDGTCNDPDPTEYRATPEREEEVLRNLADRNATAERMEIREELRSVLLSLTRDERMILLLHFRWALTQHEIGELYGFSESRANQYIKAALRRAKRKVKSKRRVAVISALALPGHTGRKEKVMSDLEQLEEKKPKVEIPPFEPKIEADIPLPPVRTSRTRPEIIYIVENLKPGGSVELPEALAKQLMGKVRKLPDWKIAQRKGAEGFVRTWRL